MCTNNLRPQVLRKRVNITNKLLPYAIKEIDPISPVNVLSVKKRELELEEVASKKRKLEYVQRTTAVKEEYKHLLEKEEELEEFQYRLSDFFARRWKNLDTTGFYHVSAFTVNNKGKYAFVGVLAEKDGEKGVYFLKGYHKNILMRAFSCKKDLKEEGFVTIQNNGLDIITLPSEETFLTFTTNGVTSYNGHSFAKVENLEFSTSKLRNMTDISDKKEEMEQFNYILMEEIKGRVKLSKCRRLEELEQGTELVIKGLNETRHRQKTRYIIQFENIDALYLSNYWLEKELEDNDLDLNFKIKIKIDALKHNPSRNKERVVFCV